MRWPLRFRGFVVLASSLLLAAASLTGCSSENNAEAGAVGTTADQPLAVTFSQTYVTIENRSGVPIVDARIEIVPRGVLPPFRTNVSRIENGQRRDVLYNQFRSRDGTPFRPGITRTRVMRVTATDVTGKTIEQEVPFN